MNISHILILMTMFFGSISALGLALWIKHSTEHKKMKRD